MSTQRNQLRAQLVLEPVHHGQDDNQRRDADANAGQRCPSDEGNEEFAGPCAYIAQTHEQGQRLKHRRDLTTVGAMHWTRVTVSVRRDGRRL